MYSGSKMVKNIQIGASLFCFLDLLSLFSDFRFHFHFLFCYLRYSKDLLNYLNHFVLDQLTTLLTKCNKTQIDIISFYMFTNWDCGQTLRLFLKHKRTLRISKCDFPITRILLPTIRLGDACASLLLAFQFDWLRRSGLLNKLSS